MGTSPVSFDALAWAVRQDVPRSTDKLVLIALADRHHNDTGVAYPSTEWIAKFGSLDLKTARAALDRLQAANLISDTGRRVGATKQVKVYFLHLDESLPKTEGSQKRKASVFPVKGTQKRVAETVRDTVGSTAKAVSPRDTSADQFIKSAPSLNALQEWAMADMGWTQGQAIAEFNRFIDSARSKGRSYKDWKAAWRNWCRSPYCKTQSARSVTAAELMSEPLRG